MRTSPGITTALAFLALAGCASGRPPEGTVPETRIVNYECQGGIDLSVVFDDAARIADVSIRGGDRVTLQQAESGAGAFYTNGQYGLRVNGDSARWEIGRRAPIPCEAVRGVPRE